MKGRIAEVFQSIQGEGLYLGERQIFVRFYGCNLNCRFCDTKLNNFHELGVGDLFDRIRSYPGDFHSVSFTGGEPLMQKNFLREIMALTKCSDYKNYLETNGTLYDELSEVIDFTDIVAMDCKLPSSTGDSPCWQAHRKFLEIASCKEVFIKIVVCNSTRSEDLLCLLDLLKQANIALTLILQPDSSENSFLLDNKLEYYKALCENEHFSSCIIPQIHKLIGVK